MLWSDKSLEEKIGADLEDFLGRQIMNTKGQKVIYKKKMGKIWVFLVFVLQDSNTAY